MGEQPITADKPPARIAPQLSDAAKLSFVLQAIVLMVSGMMLDGGLLLRVTVVAAIAYWFWFVVLVLRRGRNPTPIDLALAKLGFLVAWTIALFTGGILQNL